MGQLARFIQQPYCIHVLSEQAAINIGNPDEFTIRELADLVLEATDSGSEIRFEKLPVDDPKQRQPDISVAKSLLDWEPKISLRGGLRRTIEHFRARLARV